MQDVIPLLVIAAFFLIMIGIWWREAAAIDEDTKARRGERQRDQGRGMRPG